jgi:hypothetical protein
MAILPLADTSCFTPSISNVEAVLATEVMGEESMLEASSNLFCVLS